MLNTIKGGFSRGEETNSAQRRYMLNILSSKNLPEVKIEVMHQMPEATITFLEKDTTDILPYNEYPMVITLKCEDWEIKRVLTKGV